MIRGRKVNNITEVVLVNATTKTIDLSPGAGIRWEVLFIKQVNGDDVNRDCNIQHMTAAAAARLKQIVQNNTLATTELQMYPSTAHASGQEIGGSAKRPFLVEGTEIIRFIFTTGGASTGATDADGIVVEALETTL